MNEDLQEQMRRGVKAAETRIYSKSEPSLSRDRFNKRNEAQWLESNALFHRWMEKHPEIPRNPEGGVAQSVQKLFERYMDWTDPLAEADFEFAFGNLKSQIQLVRVPTPAEVKAHLIDRICELIASKNEGQDGKFSKDALENERKKMGFQSVEQLKARLDEVVRKQLYNGKPLSELHQIVRAANQLPDNTLPPEYTAERLRPASAFELKYLVRKFGLTAVNDRLAGRN